MTNRRARTYAVCAVKLDEDHTDAAEGTFDAALTNALVAIVAKEWDGEEKKGGRKGMTFTKPASELLELIRNGGAVKFDGAEFSGGAVSFGGARFSGSAVDFGGATSPAPQRLLAAVGTPPPAGVTLPSPWLLPAP